MKFFARRANMNCLHCGYARMCHTKDERRTARQMMLMNRKAEWMWPEKVPKGRDSIAQGAAQRSPGFAPHSAMPAPTGRDSTVLAAPPSLSESRPVWATRTRLTPDPGLTRPELSNRAPVGLPRRLRSGDFVPRV